MGSVRTAVHVAPGPSYTHNLSHEGPQLAQPVPKEATCDEYLLLLAAQDNGAGAPIHFATTYCQLDMVSAGPQHSGSTVHEGHRVTWLSSQLKRAP